MGDHLFKTIQDQMDHGFTGKINLLQKANQQLVGAIYFINGEMINVKYDQSEGEKAFYKLCISLYSNKEYSLVSEAEIVGEKEIKIFKHVSHLEKSIIEVIDQHNKSLPNRPPGKLCLVPKSEFILSGAQLDLAEFSLLSILTERLTVDEVYIKCPMLDHEITNALIGLRKKNAILVTN